jgi:hypothetical protein
MFKVLKDWKGSPDGFTVIEYKADQIVDLHPTLVGVALHEKWVEEAKETSVYAQALKGWVGEGADPAGDRPRTSRRKQNKG